MTDLPRGSDHLAVKVKPENLVLPAETRVHASGLTGRPELNGQAGKVLSADTERCVVEILTSGEKKELGKAPAEQVKLKFGNLVPLHGYNPYLGQFD